MKTTKLLMTAWMVLFSILCATAQNTYQGQSGPEQQPKTIGVSYFKTTNLIFPYAIKSVDKGSKDLLVQKAGNVENVLQVKAGKEGFVQTNLTVITSEGFLYSFIVNYSPQPTLNLKLEAAPAGSPQVVFSMEDDNQEPVKTTAQQVAYKAETINIRDTKYNISLRLSGIYIEEDMYYFQFQLSNQSNVNYTIDQLRLFISDQQLSKRTASQQVELTPTQISGNAKMIYGKSKQVVVIAVPKFTIPDKKEMQIQMLEEHGGRHLSLKVKNKQLINAKIL